MNEELPATFEEALNALQAVVKQLESGDLPLEQALLAYERGVKLKLICEQKLAEAQRRVEQISLTDKTSE